MNTSGIEWTDTTWNPVTGCTKVSEGCRYCYAERMWPRLNGPGRPYEGRAFGDVKCHPERLEEPLRMRKPQRIFVNSMSDLFHPDVPDEFILSVFDVMRRCIYDVRHTFIVLTKRPERMADLMVRMRFDGSSRTGRMWFAGDPRAHEGGYGIMGGYSGCSPMPNVHLYVSVEDQKTADERIPVLIDCPAAVRGVSYEPALGPVDLARYLCCPTCGGIGYASGGCSVDADDGDLGMPCECTGNGQYDPQPPIDHVIAGGESGPKARPSHPDWFRAVRDQCAAAGVGFFFKQWGEWMPEEEYRLKYVGNSSGYDVHIWDTSDWSRMYRTGKKNAGRTLDGRTHDDLPGGDND